ncbi:hypothetical protein BGW38_002803 [Lunasporangiospora selenospora]|uniref:Uncharacterized protein n=1 Tax=Lunasporangiospora selenospora TaxID=979761 RepID=A0A9P6G1I0_9FUNG|nr:hypothetical protein BGW38_002803 [Lunasporangiospora selenospora]
MLGDVRDPEQVDLMWMQDAIKLLQSERGIRILNRMNKMSQSERMAVFQKVEADVMRKSKSQSLQDDGVKTTATLTSASTSALTVPCTAESSAAASTSAGIDSTTTSVTPTSTFATENDVLFDVSTVRRINTIIKGYELRDPFKQSQFQAAAIVNDPKEKVSVTNLPFFIVRIYETPYYYTSPYDLDWANHSASGSKARRGDPLKPDATVLKSAIEVAYVEIKAANDSCSQSKFVEDQWNLSSEARSQIDLHLCNQRSITVVPCIQVFVYKAKLFKMEYISGLNVWTEVASGYLPRDHQNLDVIPKLLGLLRRFKAILDNINVEPYLQTPPHQFLDEFLPEDAQPQPVNVSPSKGPFFSDYRRLSIST